ncbi:MAG: leucine zipper domain-containing protein [Nitrospira sp.]|nr:leucine zipper domain-containing protein [Nitrospira sp.]MDF0676396.1 leucine zipper domain-containing protein [Nitrospira sp.]
MSWIARRLRRSREWGHKWIRRYRQGGPTWFLERSRRPHQIARRVSATFEQAVIRTHARLTSPRNPLGFYGAEAIAHELADVGVSPVHSIRTIHRILARHQLVTRRRRDRSRRGPSLPTPPARRQNDVHQLDFIVGHYLGARRPVVILNRKDIATGLVGGTEEPDRRVQRVLAFLTRDWHRHGRPRFVQMDNDMSLTGGRFYPRSLGQLIRFCLACRVIPVFTPERQPAANARVERYNGLWQEKVWQRYRFRTLRHLRARSHAFQVAYNTYLTRRLIHQGQYARLNGPRCPLPVPFRMPHPLPLCRGQIWVIRRIDENGHIQVFNETIRLPPRYAHEFVRVVIRTGPQTLSVYWTASQQGRLKRIVHRAYRLREKACTPLL